MPPLQFLLSFSRVGLGAIGFQLKNVWKNWIFFFSRMPSYEKFFLSIVSLLHPLLSREQPIYTTRAHVFQIDPSTKKNWVPASRQSVTVSYFYDSSRNSYRIISVDGTKVCVCVRKCGKVILAQ